MTTTQDNVIITIIAIGKVVDASDHFKVIVITEKPIIDIGLTSQRFKIIGPICAAIDDFVED